MNITNLVRIFLVMSLMALCLACNTEKPNSNGEVNIHFPTEPDFLHPMISTISHSTQVESNIFQALIEFDPVDLMFKPILVETLSEGILINDEQDSPIYEFEYIIRDQAKWHDGEDINAKDYEFTVKAANNPLLITNSWKRFLSTIDTIILDSNNLKKFKVRVNQNIRFAELMSGNFSIYPEHHYDPDGILTRYSLTELKTNDTISDSELAAFTQRFQSSTLGRDSILGSGPYMLDSWEPQRQIKLKKHDSWWAENINSFPNSFLAHPERLTYEIIPDEITSVTLLNEGKLDVMGNISPSLFDRLQADKNASSILNFYTPPTMKSYYLGLNGWDAILKDKNVRRALAHCLDIDKLIKTLMKGFAKRTTGPIHPQKPYYNDTIKPIEFSLEKAAVLLDESNWKIVNDDVIRSKMIDGEKTYLELEILVTQKELGKKIALLLKNNAAQIGMDIKITNSKWSHISAKLKAHDFQITPMVLSQNPGNDDLSQSWHTSSTVGGKNYYGFGNKKSDSLIHSINHLTNDMEIIHNYKKVQSIIYEEQPAIFLFTPTASIAINKRYQPIISSKNPGYFEALFLLSE